MASNKWELGDQFSDSVVAKFGEMPKCWKCGRDAVKDDNTWICPQRDTEEVMSGIKDQGYYTRNGYRARDIIQDLLKYLDLDPWESWVVGNAVKYICRYPFKGHREQDLSKAQEYLEWLKELES